MSADCNRVLKGNCAPRGVHYVERSVLAIGDYHQDRHGKYPVLLSKVHFHVLFFMLFHVYQFHVYINVVVGVPFPLPLVKRIGLGLDFEVIQL